MTGGTRGGGALLRAAYKARPCQGGAAVQGGALGGGVGGEGGGSAEEAAGLPAAHHRHVPFLNPNPLALLQCGADIHFHPDSCAVCSAVPLKLAVARSVSLVTKRAQPDAAFPVMITFLFHLRNAMTRPLEHNLAAVWYPDLQHEGIASRTPSKTWRVLSFF